MSKAYNKIDKIRSKDDKEVEEVKVEKLTKKVSASPVKHKKGLFSRLVGGVMGDDPRGIFSYLGEEIVFPAIKNIIVDSVTSAVNMAMFGETHQRSNKSNYGGYSETSRRYSKPSTNYTRSYRGTSRVDTNPKPDRSGVKRYSNYVEEYVIADRGEASQVLDTLIEQCDLYDTASVADYYDLLGVDSTYTDNSYGWTSDSILHSSIMPTRGGYVLKLPPVEVIG